MPISARPVTAPIAQEGLEKRPVTAVSPQKKFSPEFLAMMSDPERREMNRQLASASIGRRELSWQQERFISEYLADPARSAQQAMLRAGYSEATASGMANEYLKQPKIAAAIAEGNARLFRKLEITQEKVLQEVAEIAFANILEYLTPDEDEPGRFIVDIDRLRLQQGRAIKDLTFEEVGPNRRVKITLYDKMGALQLLGKQLSMFNDKLELSSKDGKQVLTINMIDSIVSGSITINALQSPQGRLPASTEDTK